MTRILKELGIFLIFFIFREILIMIGGWFVVKEKKIALESDIPGKRSAFFTGIMIILFIIDLQPYAWIMLWISLVLTVFSTIHYGKTFVRVMKQPV